MPLQKELSTLLSRGLITADQYTAIDQYYATKKDQKRDTLTLIFAAIGAILVGLAIILILAHNWDNLTLAARLVISFVPLLLAQILSGFTLLKKSEHVIWRETSSILLFFAVGASIALVSQIYNITDSNGSFFLAWVALCIPVIYVMRSSSMSLLCILGISFYHLSYAYRNSDLVADFTYYVYLLAIIPYYLQLIRNQPMSNSTYIHHWVLALSLTICTPAVIYETTTALPLLYMAMMTLFYNLGESKTFKSIPTWANAYKVIGAIGIVITLFVSSFRAIWTDISLDFDVKKLLLSREFLLTTLYTIAAGYLYIKNQKFKFSHFVDFYLILAPFAVIFFINDFYPHIWINLMVLALGINTIMVGVRNEHLGLLNFGLLIIAALILGRFFDTNASYLIRGLVFAVLGISFFLANFLMLKNQKINE